MMTQARRQVMSVATLAAVTGVALLVYLLWAVPPTLPSGQTNNAALLLFLLGMLALVFGLGALVALALHRRWPGLAGVRDPRRRADPWVAARQGVLLSLAVGVMLLLTLLRMLDVAFALVTLVLAGLIEGFFQNRRTR
jgi:succinate dehydrogenase hydrophobic anchor subunit